MQKSDIVSKRNCPCCDNETVEDNVIAAKQVAEKTNYEVLKSNWYGFFKESTFFTYYRCKNCQLLYNRHFFNDQILNELYSSMPNNTAGHDLSNLKKTQFGYFNFLKRTNLVNGDYLEFGPDIGLFTKNILLNNNFSNHYLIEPNINVHSNLIEIDESKNITLLTDLFDFSPIPDNSISLAVMVHVLDHIKDPQYHLSQIYSKLKKGGTLLIVTHNEKSLLAKILNFRWPAYCLQHPQLFNQKTIKQIIKKQGFKNLLVKKSINYFSFSYLLKHFLWSFNCKNVTIKEIPWLTIPLPLGNIITIAKKN